jgi:hypothetical protein
MAIPWLKVINSVLGVTDVVRMVRGGRADEDEPQQLAMPRLEQRLAGVVVSALKETFDRDRVRMDLEQQRADAERQRADEERLRAERAMRLELLRQAGDHEIGRQRLIAGLSLVSVMAALAVAMRAGGSGGYRIALGLGAVLLIGALGSAVTAQGAVGNALGRGDDRALPGEITDSAAGKASVWLVVSGLALIVLATIAGSGL